MGRKKSVRAEPSKNGQKVAQPALKRTDPVPCFPFTASRAQKVVQPAPKRRELKPYPRSLLTGAPYDVDDLSDPTRGGIYGKPGFIPPWSDDDKDGLPTVTAFLRQSYDWQIECWDRECRELLAKYGCGIDPRDPMPAPLPDEATEIERDAYRVIRAVGGLKKHFRAGDYFGAIMFAVDLGSLKRKLESRWADKLVDRGAVHSKGSNTGGDARQEPERPKWEIWRREAAELLAQDPDASKHEMAKLIHNRHSSEGDPMAGSPETIRKRI